MNFHSDGWIMNRIDQHKHDADQILRNPATVFGTFYQGSGNYGLDYEESDVDTKCIVIPDFNSIVFNKDKISSNFIRFNEEQIDFKDIRLIFDIIKKQNVQYLELLFTKYYILSNEDITKKYWDIFYKNREYIAHADWTKLLKSIKGIASDKYHSMEHPYPSKMHLIETIGYDPKQLHHLIRIQEFLNRLIAGESFEDCLVSKQPDYLIDVKKGCYDLSAARDIAEINHSYIHRVCNEQIELHKNDIIDNYINEQIDYTVYCIIRDFCKRELSL